MTAARCYARLNVLQLERTEAWKVAIEARQIIQHVGGDNANGGTLYSENLY